VNARPPHVKICGLTRVQDAVAAELAGAHYLGVVMVPGSPRCVDPEAVAEIHSATSLPLVLVTADMPAAELAEAADVAGASVLQLHGEETVDVVETLRSLGSWQIWKAVRVRSMAVLADQLGALQGLVDGVLMDTWQPHVLGGAGVPFDWAAARSAVGEWPPGLMRIAAGGLRPENVGEAVAILNPHVVDVSSGVEVAPGIKDPEKLTQFIAQARLDIEI